MATFQSPEKARRQKLLPAPETIQQEKAAVSGRPSNPNQIGSD